MLWSNPTPSSPRFCRPICIQFAKETIALLVAERERMEVQISHLQPLYDKLGTVRYSMAMTMVDTKVVNAVTSTSSQICAMCGATPATTNTIPAVSVRPVTNTQYGLSTLHSWIRVRPWIRVFEAVLHIAYRLPLQPPRWQARVGDKERLKAAKAEVQQKLRVSLGLRADEPRCGEAQC